MRRIFRRNLIIVALTLSVCGLCAPDHASQQPGEANNKPADVKETIAQLNRAMETAFNRDDMLGVSALYSDDAEITGEGFNVVGRKEIDKFWLDLKGKGRSWKLRVVEIGGRGELIYQFGVSDLVSLANGKEQRSLTSFVVLWKMQKDRTYRIYRDYITRYDFSKS